TDKVPADLDFAERADERGFKVALPIEHECVLFGKSLNRFSIVRGRDELTARLERSAKRQNKVANLGDCEKIVRFIPEASHRLVGALRGKYQGAYHEALLAIRQIFERKLQVFLVLGKLDDKAVRI